MAEEREESWDDWEEEEGEARCLLCEATPAVAEVLAHMQSAHGFSLRERAQELGLDTYGVIRLVNGMRQGLPLPPGGEWATDAALLQPVVPDDPLLALAMELLDSDEEDEEDEEAEAEEAKEAREVPAADAELMQQMLQRLEAAVPDAAVPDNDTYYFDSYSQLGIHETMLRDHVRTDAYRRAIEAADMAGKTVLDLGCGTGILSMFCARAGAAHVVGVDCSDVLDVAREIVAANGFADRITLVKGKLEELPEGALPVTEFDFIVSEWMGYCLLYESMFDSVIFARDRWLKPGGRLLPDRATMHVEGVRDPKQRLTFWDDVYGFTMAPIRRLPLSEPFVEVLPAESVLTPRMQFKELHLEAESLGDLDFEAPFAVTFEAAGDCDGLLVTFDTHFRGAASSSEVTLSTSAQTEPTHWAHTYFPFPAPRAMQAGETLSGTWSVRRNQSNPRTLDFEVMLSPSSSPPMKFSMA